MCVQLNAYQLTYRSKNQESCNLLKNDLNRRECLNDTNPIAEKFSEYLKYCKENYGYEHVVITKIIPADIAKIQDETQRREVFCGLLVNSCEKIKEETLKNSCLRLYYKYENCNDYVDDNTKTLCKQMQSK